jgi:hypothetical protein
MRRIVTYVAEQSTVQFHLFALFNPVPSRDEALDRDVCISDGGIIGLRVAIIQIPERVCEMRNGRIARVREECLEISAIAIQSHRWCYRNAIERDGALTEM